LNEPSRADPPRSAGQHIQTIWLPRWVLDRTWSILRQDGLKQVESTVLWGGRRFGSDACVLSVLYPCGRDVSLSSGLVRVGPDTTAEMGRWLRGQGLRALAQIHTHPKGWTGHSRTDNEGPIVSAEGFVSIVWPHYASLPAATVRDFGVHRLFGGRWYELGYEDADSLLRIVESEAAVWAPNPDESAEQEEEA
jgi:hypothetical protein